MVHIFHALPNEAYYSFSIHEDVAWNSNISLFSNRALQGETEIDKRIQIPVFFGILRRFLLILDAS